MQLRFDKNYFLTDRSRELIQKNNGRITSVEEIKHQDSRFLYAVGDYTCQLMDKNRIEPKIMVFDLLTKRGERTYPDRPGSLVVENPQGVITGRLIKTIEEGINGNKNVKIRIIGEEDLAVLPIIFYAPVNSLVVYGIPDTGTGSIRVDEKVKKLTEEIIEKMEVKDYEYKN
ncbi:MAG: GTP-dependent dephospho-CoA kinase family protein [Cuniculiplasma sp.]